MKLTEPTMEYEQQIRAYRKAFLECGDSMDGTGGLRDFENPEDWIRFSENNKNPETVSEGLVPATQYVLVREEDHKIVGMIQVRHCFNDYLEKYGGHIGYSVAPDERRKGYASQMLEMVLPECRKLGIGKVLITCRKGNEGSRKTILKNGGIYESEVYEPDNKVYLERYWIDLSE
jgi:predicted acetyltransferase